MTKTAIEFNDEQEAKGRFTDAHRVLLVKHWQATHGLAVDGYAGDEETIPSLNHALDPTEHVGAEPDPTPKVAPGARGRVITLTTQQRINRALYAARKIDKRKLDDYIRESAAEWCATIYYLLEGYNGGKDPTAIDSADRWSKPGSAFVNRTCDCSGFDAWAHGFDRYQSVRFGHIYSGWINTDSKIYDVDGPAKCFRVVGARSGNPHGRPVPGSIVTYESYTHNGRKVYGHEGTVVDYRGDLEKWDPHNAECWKLIDVVDCAKQDPNPAITMHDGLWWHGKNTRFVESIMRADS